MIAPPLIMQYRRGNACIGHSHAVKSCSWNSEGLTVAAGPAPVVSSSGMKTLSRPPALWKLDLFTSCHVQDELQRVWSNGTGMLIIVACSAS